MEVFVQNSSIYCIFWLPSVTDRFNPNNQFPDQICYSDTMLHYANLCEPSFSLRFKLYCRCCCCCGSGDRDRDFCIYKNLFLAAVWIVMVLVVLVSVSPIFYFYPRSAGQVSFPDGWTSFVFWLGYTNSSINPFIYAVKFKEFRPAFRDSLRWILCRSGTSRPDAPRWTSTNTNINFKVKYFLL